MAIDKLKSGALNLQDDVAVDTDTLFVDASTDSVGIGTTTPATTLSVNHPSYNAGYGWADVVEANAPQASAGGGVSLAVGVERDTNNQGTLKFKYVGDNSTSNRTSLGFYNNDEILNVEATGNVGVGTTGPAAKLDVADDSTNQPTIRLSTATAANHLTIGRDSSTGHYNIKSDETGSSIQFYTDPDGTGPVNRMSIDRYGYVTKPNQPLFSYLGSKAHQITTTGTVTVSSSNAWSANVNHSVNPNNPGGTSLFNASTGRFTAPVAGKYFFMFQGMYGTFSSGYLWFYMAVNGTVKSYMQASQQSELSAVLHHMVVDLAANDYVEVQYTNNYTSGSGPKLQYPGFSGFLIG